MIQLKGQIRVPRLTGKVNLAPSSSGGGPLQAKTAYPSHSEQVIAPDEDYYGLSLVKVEPVPRKPAIESMVLVGTSHLKTPVAVEVNLAVGIVVTSQEPHIEWEIVSLDEATYGFALNDNGYYESQNKGVASSFAMCKVLFQSNITQAVTFNCISYGEAGYDYGLISNVDTMLSLDNTADTSGVFRSFKDAGTADVISVTMNIPAGEHFVCIKYRKDHSTDKNNDSLQFTVSV